MTNFLKTIFKGKLTYISSALMIVWGLFGVWQGLGDTTIYWSVIWAGLATFGIRRAM
jgi:hypothetical protein